MDYKSLVLNDSLFLHLIISLLTFVFLLVYGQLFIHVITNLEPKFLNLFNLIEFNNLRLTLSNCCFIFIEKFVPILFRDFIGLDGVLIVSVMSLYTSSALSSSISAKVVFVVICNFFFCIVFKVLQKYGFVLQNLSVLVTWEKEKRNIYLIEYNIFITLLYWEYKIC